MRGAERERARENESEREGGQKGRNIERDESELKGKVIVRFPMLSMTSMMMIIKHKERERSF